MRSNRGSAAVISIIFMMFLLIIGIGFIPLMNSEVKHASMDMDEQKAWYAAEAGIKYVQAYQKDASLVKEKFGISQKLSDDSDSAAYTLKAFDKTLSRAVDGSYQVTFPAPDSTYTVYSEGVFNGVKKVITKEVVFESSNGSGGESGGGTSGGETISLPGVIQTDGKVTVANSNNTIVGDIYSQKLTDERGDKGAKTHDKGKYTSTLKTKIADSVFEEATYGTLTNLDSTGQWVPIQVEANKKYLINWPLSYNWGYKLIGASGAFVFIHSNSAVDFYTTDGLIGPASGKPITLVFDNAVTLRTPISGNIRIIASGDVILSNVGDVTGVFMLLTNGDITVNRAIKYGFLSSNGAVNLNNSCNMFVGQIQAKKNVYVGTGQLIYDTTVATSDGFVLPDGMQ